MALIEAPFSPPKKRGNPAWHKGMQAPSRVGRGPSTGMQDPGPRAKALVDMHGIEKIMKAIDDPKYLAKEFSTYDGMIIMGIGNSLRGNGHERERMFDRMFGKVPDKQINLNINLDASPEQLSDRALSLLERLTDTGDDLVEG